MGKCVLFKFTKVGINYTHNAFYLKLYVCQLNKSVEKNKY